MSAPYDNKRRHNEAVVADAAMLLAQISGWYHATNDHPGLWRLCEHSWCYNAHRLMSGLNRVDLVNAR